jgi:transcriptional regulator with XRE-family HTH domain
VKRYKLTDARNARGISKTELADEVSADEGSVARWESGTQTPNDYHIGRLCVFFGVPPVELNIDAEFNDKASTQCREDELITMLETYDRRQLLDLLSRLSVFAGIDLTALFSTTVIAPEKLLNVCEAVVEQCWNLLDQNGGDIADFLLSKCVSELESLATHASNYRYQAASLIVEAITLQIIIAIRKINHARYKRLGSDVVRFGEMSGDSNIHALALGWHGVLYYNRQPEKATALFNDALKCGNAISLLNKADIYIGMAHAYAIEGNEKLARDFAQLAQMTMPDDPELDPLYHLIRTGQSELDQRVGRVYLVLAEKFPGKDNYAETAYNACKESTSKQSLSTTYRSQALIYKAEAACVMKNMDDYLDCLGEGVPILKQTGNQQQIAKAVKILQKAPMGWRNEKRYIEIRKILTPQSGIVIARR